MVLTSTVSLNTAGAMSMPSLAFRVSFRVQSTWPFVGSSANDGRLRGAEQLVVAVGHTVRPDARALEEVLPLERAGRTVERVDVARQVLEKDGLSEHDRRARERAERSLAGELEPPLRLQARDVRRVDAARRRGACVREIEVEGRPLLGERGGIGRQRAGRRRGRGARCRQAHRREAGGEQDGEVETRHDAPS